jgi:uncharacterized membrane protein
VRYLHLLLTLSYPPAVHFALISAQTSWALWILAAVSLSQLLVIAPRFAQQKLTAIAPALILLLCIGGLVQGSILALYLPPFIIQIGLLWLFGSSLRTGREPLISRIARLVFQQQDEVTLRYTRSVTLLWTLFFGALLVETLLLTLFASLEVWSLFANIINYLLIVLLFGAEFIYRRLRFPQRTSPRQLIRIFASTDWRALLRGPSP